MCSIFCILDIHGDAGGLRELALQGSSMMKHRGPDWSGIWNNERAILAHQRLAIVDVENGAQPLKDAAEKRVLCVNGEIYNHRQLANQLATPLRVSNQVGLRGDSRVVSGAG